MYREGKTVAAYCDDCGEPIYEGETAYHLSGTFHCPGCVAQSLTVCRIENIPKVVGMALFKDHGHTTGGDS